MVLYVLTEGWIWKWANVESVRFGEVDKKKEKKLPIFGEYYWYSWTKKKKRDASYNGQGIFV